MKYLKIAFVGALGLGILFSSGVDAAPWWKFSRSESTVESSSQGRGTGQRGRVESGEADTEQENGEVTEENFLKKMLRGNDNPGRRMGYKISKEVRKAQRYQGFNGILRPMKRFMDGDDINHDAAVQFLQQRGILSGYEDGTFRPEKSISRAESLKVLLESLGIEIEEVEDSGFEDVEENEWFAKYVAWAKKQGILSGYEDGTFRPHQTVNAVELLKIAFESYGIDLEDYPLDSLPEGVDADVWYASYLAYAIDNELIDVEDFDFNSGMTRDQFSELVYRLIQQQDNLNDSDDDDDTGDDADDSGDDTGDDTDDSDDDLDDDDDTTTN